MMINIDRGNGIEEMDDSLLEKKTGVVDNQNETTTWVEYYLSGQLVHRSVHVTLKEGAVSESAVGIFGG